MTKSRITTSRWTRHVGRAARGGALGLVVLAAFAHGSARAQDDDDDKNSIWNLDKRIFDRIREGARPAEGEAPGIDYRERSPLVVPPIAQPPPAGAGRCQPRRPMAGRSRRQASRGEDRQEEARSPRLSTRMPITGPSCPASSILPGSRGRTGSVAGKPAKPGSDRVDPEGGNFLPSQLGYFGGLFSGQAFGFGGQKDEVGTFTKEPPRTTLTTPPTGYQTPSPAQPYGVSKSTGARQTTTPLDPAVGSLGN